MMARSVFAVVFLGSIALFNSGCGEAPEGGGGVKLAQAGGVITYNGSPLAGASVTFIPADGPIATATTDLSGKFQLSTGAMSGVAIGKCKVTVMAYEGGGKPASEASATGAPTSAPSSPEEMKKMMEGAKSRMVKPDGSAASGPKSIIPEIYGKQNSTKLSYTVESDASKNQFKIELKD